MPKGIELEAQAGFGPFSGCFDVHHRQLWIIGLQCGKCSFIGQRPVDKRSRSSIRSAVFSADPCGKLTVLAASEQAYSTAGSQTA